MIVPYSPSSSSAFYKHEFANQQRGSGMNVFRGKTIMGGSGIGSLFKGLFKTALPLIKKIGLGAGKHLMDTGSSILNDVVAGRNFKESAKDRFKTAGKDLLADVREALATAPASSKSAQPRQKKRNISSTPSTARARKRPMPPKQRKKDIFD